MGAQTAQPPHADGLGGTYLAGADDRTQGVETASGMIAACSKGKIVGHADEGEVVGDGVLGPAAVVVDPAGQRVLALAHPSQ